MKIKTYLQYDQEVAKNDFDELLSYFCKKNENEINSNIAISPRSTYINDRIVDTTIVDTSPYEMTYPLGMYISMICVNISIYYYQKRKI